MNTYVIRVSVVMASVINNGVPNKRKHEQFRHFQSGLIVCGNHNKDYKVTIEF